VLGVRLVSVLVSWCLESAKMKSWLATGKRRDGTVLGQTDWKWRCLTTFLSPMVATSGSTQKQLQKSEPMDHRKFSNGSKTYGLVISACGSSASLVGS
jgi:hypothetical protein